MESYITVKEHSHFEYEDRKSVFIGEAMPVSTESEAIAFIESVKKRYPDARHHVYAYVLRENTTMRFTDDHEPQGTAGMPVLDIIRKNGCTDVVIVVTRYFGGTLLGTGGLVKAYSDSAKAVLDITKFEPLIEKSNFKFSLNYDMYEKVKYHFNYYHIDSLQEEFTEKITISGVIFADEFNSFKKEIEDLSNARILVELC